MEWEVRELSGQAHRFSIADEQASVDVLKRQLEDKLLAKTRLLHRVSGAQNSASLIRPSA